MEQGRTHATLHATVTIDVTFGSDIQRDVSLRVLNHFLAAWKDNVESAHKRNSVTIEEDRESAFLEPS
jgi:hypothetical protein